MVRRQSGSEIPEFMVDIREWSRSAATLGVTGEDRTLRPTASAGEGNSYESPVRSCDLLHHTRHRPRSLHRRSGSRSCISIPGSSLRIFDGEIDRRGSWVRSQVAESSCAWIDALVLPLRLGEGRFNPANSDAACRGTVAAKIQSLPACVSRSRF